MIALASPSSPDCETKASRARALCRGTAAGLAAASRGDARRLVAETWIGCPWRKLLVLGTGLASGGYCAAVGRGDLDWLSPARVAGPRHGSGQDIQVSGWPGRSLDAAASPACAGGSLRDRAPLAAVCARRGALTSGREGRCCHLGAGGGVAVRARGTVLPSGRERRCCHLVGTSVASLVGFAWRYAVGVSLRRLLSALGLGLR